MQPSTVWLLLLLLTIAAVRRSGQAEVAEVAVVVILVYCWPSAAGYRLLLKSIHHKAKRCLMKSASAMAKSQPHEDVSEDRQQRGRPIGILTHTNTHLLLVGSPLKRSIQEGPSHWAAWDIVAIHRSASLATITGAVSRFTYVPVCTFSLSRSTSYVSSIGLRGSLAQDASELAGRNATATGSKRSVFCS